MKFLFYFLFLVVCSSEARSQACDCENNLKGIIKGIEENYAGIFDKTGGPNTKKYLKLKTHLLKMSQKSTIDYKCIQLISDYFTFFNDSHISLRRITDTPEARLFWNQVFSNINKRPLPLDTSAFKERLSKYPDQIEGFWNNDQNNLSIAIVKKGKHTYEGIVIKADSVIWYPNQIKFKINTVTSKATFYSNLHIPKQTTFLINNENIFFERYGRFTKRISENYREKLPKFTLSSINDSVACITLPSFDPRNTEIVDSLIESNKNRLDTVKYLIVDLRDNPGGSNQVFRKLLPYVLPTSYTMYGFKLRPSIDNAMYYESASTDSLMSKSNREWFLNISLKMRDSLSSKFINNSDNIVVKNENKKGLLKKIYILVNSRTASAAEQFLVWATQNPICIVAGQPTSGVIDYSNVNPTYDLPCKFIQLAYPTIRSNIVDKPGRIPNAGLKPGILVNVANEKWIDFVVGKIACYNCK